MPAPIRTTAAALAVFTALAAAVAVDPPTAQQPDPVPNPWPYPGKLAMVQRNVLVRTEGRLDHMAYDPRSRCLYVAAIANASLEVHHTPDSTRAQSIELPAPTHVLFLADTRKLLVACEGDNSVHIFAQADDGTLSAERSAHTTAEPGSLAFDAVGTRVFVAVGSGVATLDPASGALGEVTDLGGVPKGIVIEEKGPGPRLFACIPSAHAVAVLDTRTMKKVASWTIPEDAAPPGIVREWNYALALDPATSRLFVTTRTPAALHVLDSATGARVTLVEGICHDSDDCWFDPVTRRVLISGGGAGGVSLVRQEDADRYTLESNISTATGARTSCLDVAERRLYVAAPAFGDDQAYIFVYLIGPR